MLLLILDLFSSCESRLLRRATDKLKLESLVIKKGSFERRSQVQLNDNDLSEILKLEMGDAKVGKEKPITGNFVRLLFGCVKRDSHMAE